MPPKKDQKSKASGGGSKKDSRGSDNVDKSKKETKGGTAVKVRHILCEKQVRVRHIFWV